MLGEPVPDDIIRPTLIEATIMIFTTRYTVYRLPIIIYATILIIITGSLPLQAQPVKLRSFSKIGGNFTLTDMHGKQVQLSDFNKKIVILYFGYTYCPDICPNTLFVITDVLKQLGDSAKLIQVLFVTLDPERDNEKRLREYLEIFDPRILGLTGDKQLISKVARKYVIRFRKKNLDEEGAYIINHSSYAFLIDRQGIIRYLYPYKTTSGFVAKTVYKLLSETSGR